VAQRSPRCRSPSVATDGWDPPVIPSAAAPCRTEPNSSSKSDCTPVACCSAPRLGPHAKKEFSDLYKGHLRHAPALFPRNPSLCAPAPPPLNLARLPPSISAVTTSPLTRRPPRRAACRPRRRASCHVDLDRTLASTASTWCKPRRKLCLLA
jgi:hypothetical protein